MREVTVAAVVLFLARGIEDEHYWVVEEIDGVLVETPWRVEYEAGAWRLSHADSADLTELVFGMGGFATVDSALRALHRQISG